MDIVYYKCGKNNNTNIKKFKEFVEKENNGESIICHWTEIKNPIEYEDFYFDNAPWVGIRNIYKTIKYTTVYHPIGNANPFINECEWELDEDSLNWRLCEYLDDTVLRHNRIGVYSYGLN